MRTFDFEGPVLEDGTRDTYRVQSYEFGWQVGVLRFEKREGGTRERITRARYMPTLSKALGCLCGIVMIEGFGGIEELEADMEHLLAQIARKFTVSVSDK